MYTLYKLKVKSSWNTQLQDILYADCRSLSNLGKLYRYNLAKSLIYKGKQD